MLSEMTRGEIYWPVRARRTALVVEDDPRLLEAMTRWFASMHYRVLSARHYDAAVAHLAKFQAHVACVDIGLPSKSGYELCEYIRGPLGLSGLPIIVTSEHGHAEDLAQAEEAGANAFLQKPFSLRQLTRRVESLLDRAPSTLSSKGDLERLSPWYTSNLEAWVLSPGNQNTRHYEIAGRIRATMPAAAGRINREHAVAAENIKHTNRSAAGLDTILADEQPET